MNVDVILPAVGHTYEFELNDDKMIGAVIEEIVEMVSQKEHCAFEAKASELILLHRESKRILNSYQTLEQSGVSNSDTLILV